MPLKKVGAVNELQNAIDRAISESSATPSSVLGRYSCLFRNDFPTHPIPFFGDLHAARILTVAVNPSSTEFESWRRWPDQLMDATELKEHLVSYFRSKKAPPHKWFREIETALQTIGCSYLKDAAHLDVSPRATKAMFRLAGEPAFLEMVRSEIGWFWELLKRLTQVKIVFLVGEIVREPPAPGREHLVEMLAREYPEKFEMIRRKVICISVKQAMQSEVSEMRHELLEMLR